MKTFTDSQMFEWMEKGNKVLRYTQDVDGFYVLYDALHKSKVYKTARQAINGEMNKEGA